MPQRPKQTVLPHPAPWVALISNLGGAHTPYAELAALPAELRAKMRLIAYPDAFDPGDWAITPLVEGEPIEC